MYKGDTVFISVTGHVAIVYIYGFFISAYILYLLCHQSEPQLTGISFPGEVMQTLTLKVLDSHAFVWLLQYSIKIYYRDGTAMRIPRESPVF